MKILIAITQLPPISGGSQQVAWETGKRLARYKNTEVHIVTIGDRDIEIKDGMTIHYLPNKPLLTLYYSSIGKYKIKKLLRENHFDVIHVHMLLPWAYIFRNVNCKKVLTCQGDDVYKTKWYEGYFTWCAIKKSDIVTTVSKLFVTFIKNKYNILPKLVSNGVDLSVFKPINVKKKQRSVLFVGRYIKRKGLIELFNVAKQLPQYNFYFVGSGELSSYLSGKNIFDLGFKDRTELARLYPKFQICVFPSHWESFGITALEAIACGCPVIVTPKGFSEFIVDNFNGLIVPENNENSLKQTIVQLMENKALRLKLHINAIRSSKGYSWDYVTEDYFQLYLE